LGAARRGYRRTNSIEQHHRSNSTIEQHHTLNNSIEQTTIGSSTIEPHTESENTMLALFGILLIVAGAIVTFAVDTAAEGVDLAALGWILMGGGALALLAAAITGAGWMSMTKNRMHTERHMSSDGQHYVEDTHTT
jgi:hypothetical protein